LSTEIGGRVDRSLVGFGDAIGADVGEDIDGGSGVRVDAGDD
jgi:hypothetical protein